MMMLLLWGFPGGDLGGSGRVHSHVSWSFDSDRPSSETPWDALTSDLWTLTSALRRRGRLIVSQSESLAARPQLLSSKHREAKRSSSAVSLCVCLFVSPSDGC